MKKRLIFALTLLLLLSTYNLQNNFSLDLNSNYKINKIIIDNNYIVDDKKIKQELSFLYNSSIIFPQSKLIKEKLKEIDIIESFEIRKIFPNKIKIKIFEKTPVAIIQDRSERKFFTSKGDLIKFFISKKFEDLPVVFGDKDSFKKLNASLMKVKFPINDIKVFYLFESKRWDLTTRENQTIKLPVKYYEKSLINFLDLKDKNNFNSYKIFDYRINNQLILR
tara:strand:+ start:414 stop:1079 length:666 start_codon:yes stop_codon:yes gene_type:complete